jgi:hypothetical protein
MENRELNQAAFEKVVRHLLQQAEVCIDGGTCLYRGPRGLMCAVGCLIADCEYNPEWDLRGVGVTDLRRQFDPPSLRGIDGRLLSALQRVHDSDEPAEWRESLADVADGFGLSMPEDV